MLNVLVVQDANTSVVTEPLSFKSELIRCELVDDNAFCLIDKGAKNLVIY